MKVRVELREGQNPKTYDIETGKDLSDRVREIQIKPLRRADAVIYKENEDGICPYFDINTFDVALTRVPVERIEGTWVAAERLMFPLPGRGMDKFDLSAAREAIVRLQAYPNREQDAQFSCEGCTYQGWNEKEMELLNVATEALFPGKEGEALHKQMTERLKQKKV